MVSLTPTMYCNAIRDHDTMTACIVSLYAIADTACYDRQTVSKNFLMSRHPYKLQTCADKCHSVHARVRSDVLSLEE
jgi:hypothetical protein